MYSYSCVDSYSYQEKPPLIETLDLIFSPLRVVFEGRRVDLLTDKSVVPGKSWINSLQMKIVTVVSILAVSILFPPFGVFFSVALVLKAGCCIWEKNKITAEMKITLNARRIFQEQYDSQEYIQALTTLQSRAPLAVHFEKELLEMAHQLITSENNIPHLPKLCQLYSANNDSIHLFRLMVETKFQHDQVGFDLKQIEQLIKNLRIPNKAAIFYCYSVLDLFKPNDTDLFLTKMSKLNAGIGIIKIFEEYRNSGSADLGVAISNRAELAKFFFKPVNDKPKNFDGKLLQSLLLENIHNDTEIYFDLLKNDANRQHLSYLISAIRNVKNLEGEINQILPQLDKRQLNPQNPVANLKYKKKIIAHAKTFLERIDTLHFRGIKQRKRLPFLSNQFVFFIQSKQKNIDSNYEYNLLALQIAEDLLAESEITFKFDTVKFEIALLEAKQKIYGEIGELYFPPNNLVYELYREYYQTLRHQFDFIEMVFQLVTL